MTDSAAIGSHVLGVTSAQRVTSNVAARDSVGAVSRTDHWFKDWTIDGVPLRELVAERYRPELTVSLPDEHPPIREDDFWARVAVQNLRSLLGEGPAEFDDGRVGLLYCSECADPGCGVLTAALTVTSDVVEWRDIGWQVPTDAFDIAEDGFTPPMSFRFDRAQYTDLVRRLLERFESMVPPEPEPRRRRFRLFGPR